MFGRTVAWGLDIGSATIKAVKLRKTGSGVAVIDFDVVEIEHSEDDSTRPARVKAALAELVKRKKFGRTPVFFSVPGNQVFFRPFNLPAVGDRKVDEIIRYEARQQVPFALEEVVWDYQASSSGPAGELTVSLVAIRKEIVDRLLDGLNEHGLNVVGLAPSPIAVLNYVHYDVGPTETSLVLDAGAKVTDFVILNGNGFWFRPLPVAGEDLTHVFEQKFRMPHAEAENLKIKMGESKQSEKMFQVVEPTLRSLAGEIQRTAGYYKSLSRDVRIGRVFGVGHSFALPGMVEFLSRNIEMEIELLNAPQKVAVSSGVDTTWFAEEFPGMGAALGLALQALGLGKVEMCLLPEAIVEAEKAKTRQLVFGAAAAATVGLVTFLYFSASGASAEDTKYSSEMTDVIKKVAAQQKEVDEAGKKIPAREAQLKRWALMGAEKGVYGEVLEKLLKVTKQYNETKTAESARKDGVSGVSGGEVYLSDLYVSWENPLTAGFGIEDQELQEYGTKEGRAKGLRDRMYVLAKFECCSNQFSDIEPFEAKLRKVSKFKGIHRKQPLWRTDNSVKNEPLSYMLWNKEPGAKAKEGVVFWEVWEYSLQGDDVAPAGEKKVEAVAAGAGERAP